MMLAKTFYDYRFGFNGQEKDNEVKGVGNSLNYQARIQDTRLGRFLSLDPLTSKFPMLTPYQFASNSPIMCNDLDGLEGVSYRVVRLNLTTGLQTPIKRVIEVDIYIAVNEKGENGAYTSSQATKVMSIMKSKYNENPQKDEEGLPVEYKINFTQFDPCLNDPEKMASSLRSSSKVVTNEHIITSEEIYKFRSVKSSVMWNVDMKGDPNGITVLNTMKIDDANRGVYTDGHAECHELTHFLLSAAGYYDRVPSEHPNTDHDLGGWMQYGYFDFEYDENGEVLKKTPMSVNFNLTEDLNKIIINEVPRVEDVYELEID